MIVFTEISAFFAAPHLAKALDADLYVINTRYNDFFGKNTLMGKSCGNRTNNIKANTDITIIGYTALKAISHRIVANEFNRINFIISDTASCVNYKWWNEFVPKHNINLYIMPDIEPYCFIDYKPIYQYMKINKKLLISKPKKLLITHSPRSSHKIKTKGTKEIQYFISELQKKYNFDFKLITGLTQVESLKEKSQAHIHIDQLVFKNDNIDKYWGEISYQGALGKSGLEGMMMNCCVITGAPKPKTLPYFETPPIIWSSYNDFYDNLESLILNEDQRDTQLLNQNLWVDNIIGNKEFYKNYLT